MNPSNLISVVMSCYNNESSISSSIESILSQSYENFELLIMDDNSEDETYTIIKKYKANDNRVKIFQNNKNIGLTKSLNILIKNSKGSYIARQDADDISYKARLEYQINFLNNSSFDAHTTRAKVKNSQRVVPKYSIYLPNKFVAKFKNPFIHGTLLIKKSVLFDINLYDEKFYYAQDYKLFMDLLNNNYKIKNSRKVLYELNIEDNISSKFRNEQEYFAKCAQNQTVPFIVNGSD